MNIVIIGLSITSSWGNGHATTFRALVRGLAARGHDVLFLERDVPWYAGNRDLPAPPYCRVALYRSINELDTQHGQALGAADLVIVGSYVPDGVAVIDLVLRRAQGCTAFYDIDTPITLAALQQGRADYLETRQIPSFDIYLSFTGGPTLARLEGEFGARMARPLYCAVDADLYHPSTDSPSEPYDLTYLGTYSADRQPTVERLLLDTARAWAEGRFVVAGPQYPATVTFPPNVAHIEHVAPRDHAAFYGASRFTLNVTRQDMVAAGYSPSVRLFEAAACGVPIVSDTWPGLDTFFVPGREILLASSTDDVIGYVRHLSEDERVAVGMAARDRVLREHTATSRAWELEGHIIEASGHRSEGDASAALARWA